jgi:hypothetical protein
MARLTGLVLVALSTVAQADPAPASTHANNRQLAAFKGSDPRAAPLAEPRPATTVPLLWPARQATRPVGRAAWVTLGVASALALAAVGVSAYNSARHGSLQSSCGSQPLGCSSSEIDRLRASAYATDTLLAVGSAAVVTTVVLFVVDLRQRRARPAARVSLASY